MARLRFIAAAARRGAESGCFARVHMSACIILCYIISVYAAADTEDSPTTTGASDRSEIFITFKNNIIYCNIYFAIAIFL